MAIRGRAGLKRVTLELGSNSALIVDKGVDIDKIIPRCISGAFSFQGQVCISIQRIYVHEDIYEAFTERFVLGAQALKIGDPLDSQTDIAAMISEQEARRAIEWIEEAQAEGAVLACGGLREGAVVYPTVLLDAGPRLKVSCQEAFAPLVVVSPFRTIDQAFDLVNDSRYGLQAGIYTNDYETAMAAAERLHVGGVVINDIPTFRVDHMPYGGVKESGMGREGVKYAIQEMLEMKLVIMNRFGV
jgi:acyl-CoA reductase-like NAD-dependent aldehyde dehydrogenase